MDWTACKKNKLVKEIRVDINLINSLFASSSKKFKSQELLKLDDTTASSKISLAYDALRELLEALAIKGGYKVYNHECYCAFLKEILQESNLADQFDKIRIIRNSINYYGKDVSAEESKTILISLLNLIEIIKTKLK